jgi:DENN domain-containing protein 11
MCYEDQVDYELMSGDHPSFGMDDGGSRTDGSSLRPKGRCRESVRVLGMVTLNDLDRLNSSDNCRRGWIACTTDAIFLEKPSYYDLIINLTTCTPFKASRPSLYLSRPNYPQANSRSPSHRLSSVRFTWSDVKLVRRTFGDPL